MFNQVNNFDLIQLNAALLTGEDLKPAASLLYQSYHDDPLFMEIFRSNTAEYEARLRAVIREELSLFWQAGQPVIGLFYQEQLLGVACVIKPDSGISGGRLWHWRLKMLLTAGYLSTKQLLQKEEAIYAAMPARYCHVLAFIAISPKYQHAGLGHCLMNAVTALAAEDKASAGIGVFVTLEKYQAFFTDDHYYRVCELTFGQVSGTLMFRPARQE